MKIYESAYTYFPFVYLYMVSTIFGALYHSSELRWFQPYTIWIFTLINTAVYYLHDTDKVVKHVVHRHIWKTVTLSIFGIMMNNIHTEMFHEFHFESHNVNMFLSFVYSVMIMATVYYFDNVGVGVMIHIVFGFFPLSRVWQINLYMYVVYTTISIILMYRRIRVSSLKDTTYHVRPVVNYFMYLRLHDMFIMLGAFQLYLEYYKSALPEKRARDEMLRILEEERKDIYQKTGHKNDDGDGECASV